MLFYSDMKIFPCHTLFGTHKTYIERKKGDRNGENTSSKSDNKTIKENEGIVAQHIRANRWEKNWNLIQTLMVLIVRFYSFNSMLF